MATEGESDAESAEEAAVEPEESPEVAPSDGETSGASDETERSPEESRAESDERPCEESASGSGAHHVVQRGDTLTHIAEGHGLTVDALQALNPCIDPRRLFVGVRVRLEEAAGREVTYDVQRGDTLSGIAARFQVSVGELRRWNRLRGTLHAGRSLRLWTEVPLSRSESIGRPHRGSLRRPEQLSRHPNYVIRDRERAFGTLETITWITEAFDAVREAHPNAPRVRVHDISDRDGGRMRGHRSHQSGRDADIGYYRRRCQGPCPFRRVRPADMDVARQWTLLRHWLANGQVSAIFIDYGLQEVLYEEARRQGATRRQLHRWFQYPRGRFYPLGLIRHFPKHRDHLHVRFVCPETDEACRTR